MPMPKNVPLLVGSVLYLVVAVLLPELQPLNIRPIPYQLIFLQDGSQIVIRQLGLNNTYLPDATETVPGVELALISCFSPLAVFIAYHFFGKWVVGTTVRRNANLNDTADIEQVMLRGGEAVDDLGGSGDGRYFSSSQWVDTFRIIASFFFGLGTTMLLTDFIKFYVGRLRPNFYDMCGFDDQTLSCTADQNVQNEGRKSFPSGHSSLSMVGCAYVSLFLMHKLKLAEKPTFIRFSVGLVPVSIALWVAASRLVDNWHHPSDVIAGGLIGGGSAYVTFSMFYEAYFEGNKIYKCRN